MAAALARLLGVQGQQIADGVAAMHGSVAGRVFRVLGPLGTPSRVVHDAIADRVHGAVRASVGGAGRLGGLLAGQVADDVLLASTRGRALVGIVLGLIGDAVRDDEPDLAWPTVLLRDGEVVVSSAGPPPSPTTAPVLVVLLHGWCETELAWSIGCGPGREPLPDVLDQPGREVLTARMNSGVRPGELGADLDSMLEQRTGAARVVLVGHSMGGLVARAALRCGVAAGHGWVDRCDTLVTLGTPHLGAPLERIVDALVRAGSRVPEVDAITRWFDQRSVGVRDLRHGADDIAEEAGLRVAAAPLPPNVHLHTVAAALPGLAGLLFGDGLVRPVSAHARDALEARRGEPVDLVGGHFDLLCDPTVTAHVAGLVDGALASPALERA